MKLLPLLFFTVLFPTDVVGQEITEPFLAVFSEEGHLILSPPPGPVEDEIVITASHTSSRVQQEDTGLGSLVERQIMNPEQLPGGGTRREVWVPFGRPFYGAQFELGGMAVKDRGEGNGPNAPGLHAYGIRVVIPSPDPSDD